MEYAVAVMEDRASTPSKINGIVALVALTLTIFSTVVMSGVPTPKFFFAMNLIESPLPLKPTVNQLPKQGAHVNSEFRFNLASFVRFSEPEFSYTFYNNSHDIHGETTKLLGTNQGIEGLPDGVTQITTKPGDCPLYFALSFKQSCRLRFHVDKDNYTSLQGGYGPVVSMRMSWKWGSKQNRGGSANISVYTPKTITSVLAPIMLPMRFNVIPTEQNGLHYDPATSSIIGIPTQSGDYHFSVSAIIGDKKSQAQDMKISVSTHLHDTPIFRPHYALASAMPEHEYRLNLMELIEPTLGFAVSNQVRFRIEQKRSNAPWLSLDKDNLALLRGQAPIFEAGQIKQVTLIATSNTGGDSLPMTIHIPIAYDPEKKPVIQPDIALSGGAGTAFHQDLRAKITDTTADENLKLVFDNIEPAAAWLSISPSNPTEIIGIIPQDKTGQMYQVTLHANTTIGGNSDPITIPLQITIDDSKTPRLYSDQLQLPLLYTRQSYEYDFTEGNDVLPDYSEIPYTVELAKGYNNPTWLRIENNKLISDRVPADLKKYQTLFITISNIPGGKSKVWPADLVIIN